MNRGSYINHISTTNLHKPAVLTIFSWIIAVTSYFDHSSWIPKRSQLSLRLHLPWRLQGKALSWKEPRARCSCGAIGNSKAMDGLLQMTGLNPVDVTGWQKWTYNVYVNMIWIWYDIFDHMHTFTYIHVSCVYIYAYFAYVYSYMYTHVHSRLYTYQV